MKPLTDEGEWMPYVPKLFYRDIAPVVDPYHADELRQRDIEISQSAGEIFCRRLIPGEFPSEYKALIDHDTYVTVDFTGGRWRRVLAERDGAPKPMGRTIRPRRRATGRR
jgi:hypothetical protein